MKKRYFILLLLMVSAFVGILVFEYLVVPPTPVSEVEKVVFVPKTSGAYKHIGKNWIHTNQHGYHEVFVEGDALERGVLIGALCDSLQARQEDAFIHEIKKKVPSGIKRFFLHKLVAWFNRNMYRAIPQELLTEIYGISLYAGDKYDNEIGPKYARILNYHAAHDIGHGLKEMNLVGCTGTAVWGEKTSGGELLCGRNFDFYVGDEFNKNRVLYFINPSEGYPFVSVSWAGMSGVVSGMNMEGLTITLNAAPSDVPSASAAPVSLLAREILQYADNIEEAFNIAKKRKTFVSELFMVSSVADKKAVIIEKTPHSTRVFESNRNYLICTNHFQSDSLSGLERNTYFQQQSSTMTRYQKVHKVLLSDSILDYSDLSTIFLNREVGEFGNTAMGNDAAINQLNAHHSVIFNPHKKIMWLNFKNHLSGEYLAYDLNTVFSSKSLDGAIVDSLRISSDTFYQSSDYKDYLKFRKAREDLLLKMNTDQQIDGKEIDQLIHFNPDFFEGYEIAADAYLSLNNNEKANEHYVLALEKVLSGEMDRKRILEKLTKLK